ncbi:MAG: DUF4390 domain-containing protein [Thiobacillus sp.]|nr:DUF4390 domain-containing protein [Thiobacillus sp.]
MADSWGSLIESFLRASLFLLAAICVMGPAGVRAEGISLAQLEVTQKGELFQLSGHFDIQLSDTMQKALHRGVQLSFVQAVESERERAYWLAESLTEQERTIRLSYNALLRQYYVTLAGVSTSHEGLPEALRAVGDLRDWAVLNIKQMKKKSQYSFFVRMYLDISQLPKPLQVNALASSTRWQLDSGWQEKAVKY